MNPQHLNLASYVVVSLIAALAVFEIGYATAERVWNRAKKEIAHDPFEFSVVVPFASGPETLVIFLAVMLRSPFVLTASLYREMGLQPWEKSPAMREIDAHRRSCTDLLGSVSTMLSGYPERARPFFMRERGHAIAHAYRAYLDDQDALVESQKGSPTATA